MLSRWMFAGLLAFGAVSAQAASFTEYALPTASSGVATLAVGPDGNIWFTESTASKVGRVTTAGVVTEYALPTFTDVVGVTRSSEPSCIIAGPDGALWFNQGAANRFSRITTAGVITSYSNFTTDL